MTAAPRTTTVGALGLVLMLTIGSTAFAAPVSKCNAAKKKCIGKYVAAVLGCHAKAEGSGDAVAPECITKAVAKITGAGKGCFDKNDAKSPNDCPHLGDATQQLADADALVAAIVSAVDPAYPAPTLTKCGAARKKCAAKKAAGLLACSAKLNKGGGAVDPACASAVQDKFGGAKGCDTKALAKGSDCLGTTTTAGLEATVDAWAADAELRFDYVGPACGNGFVDPGEFCDPAGPNRPNATCGSDFACNPTTCTCDCPSTVHFLPDPTSSKTNLDIGWTGLGHRTPTLTNADLSLAVSGCSGAERPCGVCNLSGPVPNTGPGALHNQRCSNDTSIRCTDDTPCADSSGGVGGTCGFYLSSNLPISTAGVSLCTVSRFAGPIAGTLNLESGAAATTVSATMRVYAGFTIDDPCPICAGDTTMNDEAQNGTCTSGQRAGLECDANATAPARPDFGATSLDCPPIDGALLAQLPLDLSSATADVVKTLSASSPTCNGAFGGARCLCSTCNNAEGGPCDDNADCPDPAGPIGPVCGGRRCLGGPNLGAACNNNTECPGVVSGCSRLGEPTKPSSCIDDSTSPGPNCTDTAPVDGEGECTSGPTDQRCTAPHAQRFCSRDSDCTPGTCVSVRRPCFLTGDGATEPGTGTLVAVGEPSPPLLDGASPVLGSVFCTNPTGSAAVNNVLGLPGPSRLTVAGTLTLTR